MSGWLTAAAAAAASPATAALLSPGDDPAEPPELPWRLGSAVTVPEPSGYAWDT